MSEESCKHAIGTATVEYQETVIHVDDRLMRYQHFCSWDFCPYCGKEVSEEVGEMHRSISANEEQWKEKYGSYLGG